MKKMRKKVNEITRQKTIKNVENFQYRPKNDQTFQEIMYFLAEKGHVPFEKVRLTKKQKKCVCRICCIH